MRLNLEISRVIFSNFVYDTMDLVLRGLTHDISEFVHPHQRAIESKAL